MKTKIISLLMATSLVACSSTTPDSAQEQVSVQEQVRDNAASSTIESTLQLESIEIAPPASQLPAQWWEQAVFYEVFVRAYSDSSGDGHGDLQGLIAKLDYLEELGVTGLWLMPVTESEFNANGYDVKDLRQIEQDYGSLEDFQQLIDEAHQRGMGVIIDWVVNHTSNANPIFQDALRNRDSQYRDWFIWSDRDLGWGRPWDPAAKVWHRTHGGYYYGLFFDFLPDWNYRNPEVIAYMKDSAKYWLNMGVDGFRVDAASHLIENGDGAQENQPENHAVYQEFRELIDHYPNAFIVAEAPFSDDDYLGDGSDEFHSVFCFKCSQMLMSGVKNGSKRGVHGFLKRADSAVAGANYATLLSNHDPFAGERAVTAMRGNHEKAKLAASLMLTGPGIPFVYYGEEIGMTAIDRSLVPWEDAVSRIPMHWDDSDNAGFTTAKPWRNINPDYPQVNVAQQVDDPQSMLSHYRQMIALRNQHPALATGEFELLKTSGEHKAKTVAFVRHNAEQRLLVVANLDEQPQEVQLSLAGSAIASSQPEFARDLLTGERLGIDAAELQLSAALPAFGLKVYSLE
ncbi:alpha-amylase family glycosyl hydrolase [Aliagarivorans taiwanensis]|uniref:alpha-amylase family glycosyl hydrolase n=1 Tax=Aliagarivorans taiwanensis TaxID=561966 RepID=UPI000412C84B|nr:alpha-amylase family glycosyl hydrolase [Aliagarivorans taiwanensis]